MSVRSLEHWSNTLKVNIILYEADTVNAQYLSNYTNIINLKSLHLVEDAHLRKHVLI